MLEAVEAALASGVDAVQLRDKDLPDRERWRLGREVSALARRHGALFFVNDSADLALAFKAHGIQLGAASLPIGVVRRLLPPESRIGYSAHSAAEAEGAALAGADFVLLAPVFAPGSKSGSDAPPLGAAACRSIAAALPIPVYALGGMNAERTRMLVAPNDGTGSAPAGVAVVSAILGAEDPGTAAGALRAALDGNA